MGELIWEEGHPTQARLRGFADGRLDEAGDVEVEEHLMFHCPDGKCCRVLDGFPNSMDAVLRAIARRHRPGRRWCNFS